MAYQLGAGGTVPPMMLASGKINPTDREKQGVVEKTKRRGKGKKGRRERKRGKGRGKEGGRKERRKEGKKRRKGRKRERKEEGTKDFPKKYQVNKINQNYNK